MGEVDNNLRYIGGTSLEEVYGQSLRIIIVRYSNAKEIPINLHTWSISTMVVDSHAMTEFAILLLNIRTATDLSEKFTNNRSEWVSINQLVSFLIL